MPTLAPRTRRFALIEDHLRRLIGEGAATLFRDARRLVEDARDLENQSVLVWHCAREIESAIFEALNPVAPVDEAEAKGRERAAQVEAIIESLGLDETDPAIVWWRRTSLHAVAHRANLGAPRPFASGDWQTFLKALETILDAFEARYDRMLARLDELLAMSPARAGTETKRLLCSVPPTGQATALRHFFERADVRWLSTLPRCVLENPPDREYTVDQPGYFRWPFWHASRYLAKVAPERPQEVHRLVMRVLKRQPENPWIHADFTKAAKHFPSPMRASWATAEAAWAEAQEVIYPPLARDFANEVVDLVEAGLADAAFALGTSILTLANGPRPVFRDPGIRMSEYEYRGAIDAISPAWARADSARATRVLADLVDRAASEVHGSSLQYSQVWRQAISRDTADDPSPVGRGPLDDMIDALCIAAEALALEGRMTEAMSILASHGSSLFQRVRLDLLTRHHDLEPDVAHAIALEPDTYTSDAWIEAYHLLDAVMSGLDVDRVDELLSSISEDEVGPSRLGELGLLVSARRAGTVPSGRPTGIVTFGGIERPASPLESRMMRGWSVTKTIEYLSSKEPIPDRMWTGLEEAFYDLVKAWPQRWAKAGSRLEGLAPRHLERYLWALREAVQNDEVISWKPLVMLLDAQLANGGVWTGGEYAGVRQGAVWLLLAGVERGGSLVRRELREPMWRVIRTLSEDLSPTPEEESRGLAGNGQELAHIALNHTRPVATTLTAVFGARVAPRAPVKELPSEARSLLEARCQPSELSLGVRYAVGERVPRLWVADPSWTIATLPLIFPAEPDMAAAREAAWAGYLSHPTIYLSLVPDMLPQYVWGVEALALASSATGVHERLAEHLLLLARAGTISCDSEDQLLAVLFHSGPEAVARGALHDAGWSLWKRREGGGSTDEEEVSRLRLLMDWLFEEAAAGRVEAGVLGAFAWWFSSGEFDVDWSLDRLEYLARSDVALDPLHVVFERLKVIMDSRLARVAEVLDAIVGHAFESEHLYGDALPATVVRLLDEPVGSVPRMHAENIVNRMVSRGFAGFPAR